VSQRTYPNEILTNDLNLTIEQWVQIRCGCSHKQKRSLEMNTQAQSGWGVALTGSVHHVGKTSSGKVQIAEYLTTSSKTNFALISFDLSSANERYDISQLARSGNPVLLNACTQITDLTLFVFAVL
jgi:hypothetical protein